MDQKTFDEIVDRLTRDAERSPGRYRIRVLGLAVLGYAVLVLFMLLALALSIGVLAVLVVAKAAALFKFVWIPFYFAYTVFKSLWVRIPAPQGRRVRAKEAPALHREINSVARQVGAPRVHAVLLVDAFNAAVSQVPRLGVFGWQKNYLMLGLPLLLMLSPDELRAVLAHEFGHLSRRHSRFAAWIYRLRRSWVRVMESLDQAGHRGRGFFERFLRWYAPYFSAYTFVLARADEYEADRCTVRLVGPEVAAQTLVNVEVCGALLGHRYWRGVYALADEQPEPPRNPYAGLRPNGTALVTADEAERYLGHALQRRTDSADTHPSLADRVKALGVATPAYQPGRESAAEVLLGAALPAILEEFGNAWCKRIHHKDWRERHAYVVDAKRRLKGYEQTTVDTLSDPVLWDYARFTEEFRSAEAAVPLYRQFAERAPEHAAARFAVGRLLLAGQDESGVAWLEQAMTLTDEAVKPGCELIYHFLMARDRSVEAEPYATRWRETDQRQNAARAERQLLDPKDELLPHDLPAKALANLVAQLAKNRRVGRALLFRKKLSHAPESPLFVLLVEPRGWIPNPGAALDNLTKEIRFDGAMSVFLMTRRSQNWKRARKIPGARIYRRRLLGFI